MTIDMNIYKLTPDGTGSANKWVRFYAKKGTAIPLRYADMPAFFDVHPRIEVERGEYSRNKKTCLLADCSSVSSLGPVFSDRAKKNFEPSLEGLGRWIELVFDEAPYWLFFNTNVADVLEPQKCEFKYFRDGGLMEIIQYAFNENAVKNQFLFSLSQQPGRENLVTDAFVNVVRENKLTGFWFLPLWNSETGPAQLEDVKDWLKPRITGLE
jgi:hypothetical protein